MRLHGSRAAAHLVPVTALRSDPTCACTAAGLRRISCRLAALRSDMRLPGSRAAAHLVQVTALRSD
jgi:hypothetical protein